MLIKRFLSIVTLIVVLSSCKSASYVPYIDPGLLACNVEAFPKTADKDLFYAVKSGHTFEAKNALNQNANINVSDRLGQTILMWACWNGNIEMITLLMEHDDKNIKEKTKNYVPLKYDAISKHQPHTLNYNALFCLIMSNSVDPKRAESIIKIFIEKTPDLLNIEDSYGENLIHKIIRSNNSFYAQPMFEMMNPSQKTKLINKKNKEGENPILLAVKQQNENMVEILINNDVLLDVKDNDGKTLPVIAFDNAYGDSDIFLKILQGKLELILKQNKGYRIDKDFEDAREICLKSKSDNYLAKVMRFSNIYDAYKNPDIKDPDGLDVGGYKAIKEQFISIIQKQSRDDEDMKSFNKILEDFNEVVYLEDEKNHKPILQLVIENRDFTIFREIFRTMKIDKIKPTGNGSGDYLVLAILNKNYDVMNLLLNKFPTEFYFPKNLMNAGSRCDIQYGDDVTDPLQIFCMDIDLTKDNNKELLRKVTKFYSSNFDNSFYCGLLLNKLVEKNLDDIYIYFLDNYGTDFYKVKQIEGKPIINALLDKQEYGIVKKYVDSVQFNYETKIDYPSIVSRLEQVRSEQDVKELLESIEKRQAISQAKPEISKQ
ncbi:hypothetical protein AGMMS50276_31760 [Synergistales bacterium]|nr:hypothetical protein AGMMS50276_31760 [Synergistales bacterium]